jgi:NADH:ubiquinone oxidoreductase subunit F (NADH-binding)
LFGMPTVVHNVQTLAAVPWIVRNGAAAFAATGDPASPGTVLVQLRTPGGDGIAEVPLGTSLKDILGLVARLPKGRSLQALLIGGPAGGLLPPDLLDTPYTFDALRAAGAHLGSGSIVAVDDRTDLVELVGVLTRFCSTEACGKSIPCRIGTKRLAELVSRKEDGLVRPTDDQLAADLCHDIVASALCDHERLATLPLTSGMRYFGSAFDRASRPVAAVTEDVRAEAPR